MPTRVLSAYVRAIPAMEAERAAQTAEQIAVGVGRLPPEAHRGIVDRWRQALPSAVRKARTPGELAGRAAASGLGFRRVARSTAPDGPTRPEPV